jgi:chorismate mutase
MQRLRQQVDRIDLRMLHLLQQRTKLSGEIGRMKRRHGAVVYVPEREQALLSRLIRLSKGQPSPRAVAALYREILSGSRAAQGQKPIGLLQASNAVISQSSHHAFGACDQFSPKKTWPELAKGLGSGALSLALLTGDDLLGVLADRWRGDFLQRLWVAGDIRIPSTKNSSLTDRVFIVTPKPQASPRLVSRIVILIECKSTQNAIKSLRRSMPDLSLQPEPLQLPQKRGSMTALACLNLRKPADGLRAANHLTSAANTAGLSLSILGSYLSTEDYGG